MKILKHTASHLVIKDGYANKKLYLLHTIFGSKYNSLINISSGSGIIALYLAWKFGKLPHGPNWGMNAIFFILAALLLLSIAARPYRGTPQYTFDKASKNLVIDHDEASKSYPLADILQVKAVTVINQKPPPKYWRSIHLLLRSGEELKLYPGHDDAKKQDAMAALIQDFLNLG